MITTDISNCFLTKTVNLDQGSEKEIHFHKDYPINGMRGLYVTHNQTKDAIKRKEHIIHTTSLTNLSFDLLDDGYRIYLHENGKVLECKLGSMEGTNKEIRRAHNILRLVVAEVFYNYFYGDELNNPRHN